MDLDLLILFSGLFMFSSGGGGVDFVGILAHLWGLGDGTKINLAE